MIIVLTRFVICLHRFVDGSKLRGLAPGSIDGSKIGPTQRSLQGSKHKRILIYGALYYPNNILELNHFLGHLTYY